MGEMRERKETQISISMNGAFILALTMLFFLLIIITTVIIYEHQINVLEAKLTAQETWNGICWDQVQEKNGLIGLYKEQTLHCSKDRLNPLVTA